MVSWCFHAPPHIPDDDMYLSRKETTAKLPASMRNLYRDGNQQQEHDHPHQPHDQQQPREDGSTTPVLLAGYHPPPRWVKDELVEACSLCSDQFDFFLTRKHHCRSCGLVYCKSCASHFARVAKYGFVEPVRLCNTCNAQVKGENLFYDTHLPAMEAGDVFTKHGLLRKRVVHLKFVRAKNIFQYQSIDVETRQYQGIA